MSEHMADPSGPIPPAGDGSDSRRGPGEASTEFQISRVSHVPSSRGPVRRVVVRFGDGHSLALEEVDGTVTLRMDQGNRGICLDASGPGCDFERAVNLLRLHMPRCARDSGD